MTLILDSGGVTALAGHQARLAALRDRALMPPTVPVVVLTECLTGDNRRDYHVNRLLDTCLIAGVDEAMARTAARLRSATRRAGTITAVDALVVSLATQLPDPMILTSNPNDISALVEFAARPIIVVST